MKYNKQQNYLLSTFLLLLSFLSATAQTNVTNSDVYTGQADITATTQVRLLPGFRAVQGSDVRAYIDPAANYTAITYNPAAGGTVGTPTPTTGNNYVWTTALRGETTTEAGISSQPRVETVNYFDGLGRPVQTIAVQGSPLKKDVVQAMDYDEFGRQNINYLPYAAATNTGVYVNDAESGAENFYNGTIPGNEGGSSPWNKTEYEPSPLNRVTGVEGPGAWQSKPTAVSYSTNSTTTTGTIQHWRADNTTFNFGEGELYVITFTDEDGNQTREYKDKLGRVVRKEAHDGTNWLRTAYVYDDFGLLRTVVPPKATGPASTELCYFYEYDDRKRMTQKDLPGADPVYMIYDKRDRLVMVQDGNLRGSSAWIATIYDELNRPVITCKVEAGTNRTTVQGNFDNFVGVANHSSSGSDLGYTTTSALPGVYSFSESNIQTVTYYDKYEFLQAPDFTNDDYGFADYPLTGYTTPETIKRKGLISGTLVRVLENGSDIITDGLLLTVNYYDNFGRPIRMVSDNHFGKTDVVYNAFNFAGEVTSSTTIHNYGETNEVKLATTFAYDHQGRLLTEKAKVNNETEITLAAYKYNELGEVIAKYLHGDAGGNDFNQKIDYTYNIKGWLRTLNQPGSLGEDLFALDLQYNNPGTTDNLTASAAYNGNISEMRWDDGTQKGYGFTYDGLSRITAADYADGSSYSSNQDAYNTTYGYDVNGNIGNLTRKLNGTQIDNLTYTYPSASNQLQSVNDATANSSGYDDNNGTYTYDSNGNLNYDPSKGVDISYNYLNLPDNVEFGANDNLRYTYDAAGNKRTKVVDGTVSENNTRLDYSGNFLYENNNLKTIFTSEGRIIPFDNNGTVLYKFEYNLKDHLGNTRVTFGGHSNGQPEVMQTTEYYPFGLIMNQQNYFADGVLSNKYLYNGKELQDDELAGSKLDWYDYGARFYDPQLGRWHVPDPLAEYRYNLNPYHYVMNNPLRFIDPNGLKDLDVINVYGKKPSWFKKTLRKIGNFLKKLDNGRSGDTQPGGIPFVKSGPSASPTKNRAEHTDRQVNIDDLMPVIGGAGARRFQKSLLDFAQGIGKASDLIQETKDANIKTTSDEIIKKETTGKNTTETDGTGKPIITETVKAETWKTIKTIYSINKSNDTISVASGDGYYNGDIYYPNDTLGTSIVQTKSVFKRVIRVKKYPSRR